MKFYAHTAEDEAGNRLPESSGQWQLLSEHLLNVSRIARRFAEPFGLGYEAEVAGLLHDLGKYANRFQQRLRDPSVRGINHWAAGAARAAEDRQHCAAFAIDGHHTGIPSRDGDGLKQTVLRMRSDAEREGLTRCTEPIAMLMQRFADDRLVLPTAEERKRRELFAEALATRFIFSCLVDADFLDTEQHFTPASANDRRSTPLQAQRALELLKSHLGSLPGDGGVNQRRRELLSDCLKAAENAQGLFTLTAPTGSGKTLSSMAFALQHIVHHNARAASAEEKLRRVIIVIPYTSIIEQTARVYRDLFEPIFGPRYVLEHHSAVAPRERREDREKDAEEERLRRARIASENWDAPIVVTTSVRFFESLFSNRPSDCRRLHNIARSVVLFDEVQTLPHELVPSLLSAVKLLTRDYGVTAVFMTATQPAFDAVGRALPFGWSPTAISANESALAEALRRTQIQLPNSDAGCSWEQIADEMEDHAQALCVVNTTAEGRVLFELLRRRSSDGVFHLSSRLCPQHRREKLDEIRERLKKGAPCRLVSTQLIEAGVDVDFPIAFRALGPLDSIIQTAGRCNREGKYAEPRPVIVFRPLELRTSPGAYRTATLKTVEFLKRNADAAARLHLPEFYAQYFRELYGLLGPAAAKGDTVFAATEGFDFPKAADECSLIGDETRAVLVKWRGKQDKVGGTELAEKLAREKHFTREECRMAQRYSVNLYQGEFENARRAGYIHQPTKDWEFWVWDSQYDDQLGLGHLTEFIW